MKNHLGSYIAQRADLINLDITRLKSLNDMLVERLEAVPYDAVTLNNIMAVSEAMQDTIKDLDMLTSLIWSKVYNRQQALENAEADAKKGSDEQ